MLPQDIESFQRRGFIKLEHVFNPEQAEKMQDLIWSSIEEQFGVSRDDQTSWPKVKPPIKLQHLRGHEDFKPFGSDRVRDAFNHLLGKGHWKLPWHWGQFLVGFPTDQSFDVPHEIWHTDFDFVSDLKPLEGLLFFSLISDVPSGAGGTMLIEGSHHFVKQFIQTIPDDQRKKMKTVRKALYHSHPWFGRLTDPKDNTDRIAYFMNTARNVDGIDLKVHQITGSAGDVVIGHPWLLHASSPNCTQRTKMMRVHRIHRFDRIGAD